MNCFFAYRRLFSLGFLIVTAAGWGACSSSETKEAYDKYYGKGRSERAAEAVVADSIKRVERKAAREAAATPATPAPSSEGVVSLTPPAEIAALLEKNTCSVCHKSDERLVGPAWVEVAKKNYSTDEIVSLVYEPKPEHWPDYPPMAPLAFVPKEDIIEIGTWINSLK